MKMADSQRIQAPREVVWAALNDPEVLRQSIPGCQELVKTSDTEMEAKVQLKIGPVKAAFNGKVRLEDLNPPESYRIAGEGSGGVAGFAKGGASVRLEEDGPDATILHYEVDAQIGGKIAQLGARLIDSTAKRLAGEFFTTFGNVVAPQTEQDGGAAAGAEPEDAKPEEAKPDETKKGWFGGLLKGKKDDAQEGEG
ncbi:SRPBCC family protein [Roseibium litorale]|uniref:Carbon monoxide dehydrogenase subunit G n=1 Tax=Roseibium litorale TaxID=2803841 RepID=A0ABR9CTT4_9HYPH|nr:carbon monoxide dehydrogenase subunit G [Roseibium litorale]MBD8894009.1 carbon monoxide dehydrogenase subunit G [Roseibium litorale]